jgi:hypothetical protein
LIQLFKKLDFEGGKIIKNPECCQQGFGIQYAKKPEYPAVKSIFLLVPGIARVYLHYLLLV